MHVSYLPATDLGREPALADAMFRDRAAQFRDRLGWEVAVDALGWETDAYDRADPIYAIVRDGAGGHAGSLRFLPTTGPNMLAEIFPDLTPHPIRDPAIWEATRFCLAPGAPDGTAALLLVAASQLGLGLGLSHAVGVFDHVMTRLYRRLGWAPELLGRAQGRAAGLWRFDDAIHDRLCARAHMGARDSRFWFEAAFPDLAAAPPLPIRG